MYDIDLLSKRVRILFEDLGESNSKIGTVLEKGPDFITVQTSHKVELIPVSKIIRIEVLE